MRVLLDECLPRRLKRDLPGHEVLTVPEAGWASLKNGVLLRLAAERFDVFLTVNRALPFQQHGRDMEIAIVVLIASANRLDVLRPLMPAVLKQLDSLRPGTVTRISG